MPQNSNVTIRLMFFKKLKIIDVIMPLSSLIVTNCGWTKNNKKE